MPLFIVFMTLWKMWKKITLPYFVSARKQEIIKITEQLIGAITSGDYEAYTYVTSILCVCVCLYYRLPSRNLIH